ncbi:MAG: hypothetical protein AAF090_16115 [Bacteroidota bacterium]
MGKTTGKGRAKRWILVSAIVLLASIVGSYFFLNGYLISMETLPDGRARGSMRQATQLDAVVFLSLIGIGLVALTVLVFSLVRYLTKSKA